MATAQKAVEAVDVVEDVKDLVEDSAEFVGEKFAWLNTTNAKLLLVGVSAFALGATASYAIAAKRLEKKWQEIADEQVESVKAHYSTIRKDDKSLAELAEKYTDEEKAEADAVVEEIVTREGYVSYDKVESDVDVPATPITTVAAAQTVATESSAVAEVIHHNIFESEDPDTFFDMTEELARRANKPDSPFVITLDEFNQGEMDYQQSQLTFYDGDDVLADQSDKPIDDVENVVGYENLLRFGHASGDPNIVYIRNNKLEMDFELLQHKGKFAKEVLGFDDELQHSHQRRPRRFRDSDE